MIYRTKGTCSQAIDFDLNPDGTIEHVTFIGGCNGNTQGLSALLKGMKADEAVARLKGLKCGYKNTSCPDQLAQALEQALASVRR